MGLLFPEKMQTLILVHRGTTWSPNATVFDTVLANPHPGFFTTEEDGTPKPVKPDTVRRALSDARFWGFVELDVDRSRLTNRGVGVKHRGSIELAAMATAIADTLEEKSTAWSEEADIIDLQSILDDLDAIPDNVIPSPDWLWSEFTTRHPLVFRPKRLSRTRFRQLLLLLGRNGTGTLDDVPIRGYFLPTDWRLANLRPEEE